MYQASAQDILFMVRLTGGLDGMIADGLCPDLDGELAEAILTEAARFATEEIAPLNRLGDKQGASLQDGVVTLPPEWSAAYKAFCEGGWNGLSAPTAFEGQGLPVLLAMATQEMWNAAAMAFGIGTVLTTGAIEALNAHGSEALKAKYLPRMVSGEWTGTMNLTEPQSGSDLSTLRSRAEPNEDGSYKIFGQKIYITYGEHQLTENIIHLVLARLPNAPEGTRGISLFLVPKFMVNEDGSLGVRNDVFCSGIEHKLGIHGSPTCTMNYGDKGGAIGYLIGEENKGLKAMFTMMNNARLAVGIQGVAIAERALQQAIWYAGERVQGQPLGQPLGAAIMHHADVKRMLLSMQSQTNAARAICYANAHAIDRAHLETDPEKAAFWRARADLLTPISKAYATDVGVDVASFGVQVHGGMGYVEETGAAQHLRDARIAPIYEGTNGIQALDLVFRKLPMGDGKVLMRYIEELSDLAAGSAIEGDVECGLAALKEASLYLGGLIEASPAKAQAVATPYLRLFALAAGAAYLALAEKQAGGKYAVMARFFAQHELCQVSALKHTVMQGAEAVLAADPAQFGS
jgi:alkylation response protein AidB-like acyl-CoA dehydrogenase